MAHRLLNVNRFVIRNFGACLICIIIIIVVVEVKGVQCDSLLCSPSSSFIQVFVK